MDWPCYSHVKHSSPETDPILPIEGRSASPPVVQKKRFKDNIKISLKKFKIPVSNWEQIVFCWKTTVQEGAVHHEMELCRVAETKRQHRKEKEKKDPLPFITSTLPCPHCTNICGSRSGLYSHLKTHEKMTLRRGQSYLF